MATGRTAEGTTWRTRPYSDDLAAAYRCTREGGALPCTHHDLDMLCEHETLGGRAPCYGKPEYPSTHFVTRPSCASLFGVEGAKVKPYSPATPKGSVSDGLPASVGADFADACRVAIPRLQGLEPWPTVKPSKAPRLSQLAKPDANREFIAAVWAALAPDAAWRQA